MNVEIKTAYDNLDEIRVLFKEYTDILVEGDEDFKAYLEVQKYDDELLDPMKKYGMPDGRLYIVYCDGEVAGCGAFRKLDDESCEIKRVYVREAYRDCHVGSAILKRIMHDAKEAGYKHILLDTLTFLKRAIEMYKNYGFYFIEQYNDSPMDSDSIVYMQYDF